MKNIKITDLWLIKTRKIKFDKIVYTEKEYKYLSSYGVLRGKIFDLYPEAHVYFDVRIETIGATYIDTACDTDKGGISKLYNNNTKKTYYINTNHIKHL